MVMLNLSGGRGGGNKMHYGLCENGEYGVGGKTTEMRRRRENNRNKEKGNNRNEEKRGGKQ